jgi:cell division protein FtsB
VPPEAHGASPPDKLARTSPFCDVGPVEKLGPWIERALPIVVLVVALVGAPVMIFSPEGLPRLRGLERELAAVEEENRELAREIEERRAGVTRLRDDPAALERIARDDLGLVRQTEVVFQFQRSKR